MWNIGKVLYSCVISLISTCVSVVIITKQHFNWFYSDRELNTNKYQEN